MEAKDNETTVNISILPCGVYLIKVKTENGVTINKFVKE